MSFLKDDLRPAKGGWAPGGYLCLCACCKRDFAGDKRSVQCADCAYAENTPGPFDAEKKIRSGGKRGWGYEELTGNLQVAPLTWLPALLIRVVSLCVIRKVFKDDAALLRIVNKAVTDARDEAGVLRGDQS